MGTTSSLRIIPYNLSIFPINIGAVFLVATTPTTETNHFIKFLPLRERIVSGMNHNKAATFFDVFNKGFLSFFFP